MFTVYTEIHNNGIERWFYGNYETANRANEVALELGGEYPVYHCVCRREEAEEFGILNMDRY